MVENKKEVKIIWGWKSWLALALLAFIIVFFGYFGTLQYIADKNYQASLTPQERFAISEEKRIAEEINIQKSELAQKEMAESNIKWIQGLFASPINTFTLILVCMVIGFFWGRKSRFWDL